MARFNLRSNYSRVVEESTGMPLRWEERVSAGARARDARVAVAAAIVIAAGLSAPAGTAAASRHPPSLHGDVIWPAGKTRAPGFELRDERGTALSLAAERGQVVLLTFMYSRCRQLCPIEGRLLAATEQHLGRSRRPLLLVVSVDPGGDTPATIGRFVRRAGLAGDRWHWLVGSRAQLARVWRAYGIDVKPGGDIGHSGALYLIDRRGYERSGYAVPFLPNLVAADLHTLARESG
jgi:protein SCO1/2